MASFTGVGRRLERKGEVGGVVVYDDYGHHPTAIRETLAAVRQREPGRRVWAVYEPLTYHRTAALLDAFADVLAAADAVAIADIWAGRDPDTTIASAAGLAAAVAARRAGHRRRWPPVRSRRRPTWLAEARCGRATWSWSWGAGVATGSGSCCWSTWGADDDRYAAACDLLEASCEPRRRYDGDAWTALFTEDAEYLRIRSSPPLVGHNALRAYLLAAAEAERWFDMAIERHWVAATP